MSGKILIIEDDVSIRDSLEDVLKNEGYRVVSAANGEEGLVCARETKPDLILLDLMMPVMDGFDFLKAKAADPELAKIALIVVSAGSNFDRIPEGIARIRKPPELDELMEMVEARIGSPN